MSEIHRIRVGDTRTPLGATLKQDDTAVDLTGLTVQFKMTQNSDGSTVRDWASATVVTAASGLVSYDFPSADVDTAGDYRGWFRIVESAEYDTFGPIEIQIRSIV